MTLSRQVWLHKRSTSSCLQKSLSLTLCLSVSLSLSLSLSPVLLHSHSLARHASREMMHPTQASCSELKATQWIDFQAMRFSTTFCEGFVAIGSTVFACCSANHSLAKQASRTTQRRDELHEWINGSQAAFFMIQYTALHGR